MDTITYASNSEGKCESYQEAVSKMRLLLERAGMRTTYALRTFPFPKENGRFSKRTVEQKYQDGIFETSKTT